jgi:hypothetical protein
LSLKYSIFGALVEHDKWNKLQELMEES